MTANVTTEVNAFVLKIRKLALERLAYIFSVPASMIESTWQFGEELKASFRSEWRENELDIILDDINYVANSIDKKMIKNGELTIKTVGDYLDFMTTCAVRDDKSKRKVLSVLTDLWKSGAKN